MVNISRGLRSCKKFMKGANLKQGELSFLDVFIKNHGELITSIYHKDSDTGLLTKFRSFAPHVYKVMLVNAKILTDENIQRGRGNVRGKGRL